jgi:hypothetical protein
MSEQRIWYRKEMEVLCKGEHLEHCFEIGDHVTAHLLLAPGWTSLGCYLPHVFVHGCPFKSEGSTANHGQGVTGHRDPTPGTAFQNLFLCLTWSGFFAGLISQCPFVEPARVAGRALFTPTHLPHEVLECCPSSSFSSMSTVSRKILTSTLGPATWRSFSQALPSVRDRPGMGDLNNTAAVREHLRPVADPAYHFRSFAIPSSDDDPAVRERYRPFLLDKDISDSDWVATLELATAVKMVETEILAQQKDRLKILVLYGSLRTRFEPHTGIWRSPCRS